MTKYLCKSKYFIILNIVMSVVLVNQSAKVQAYQDEIPSSVKDNMQEEKEKVISFPGHKGYIRSVAYSPDGKKIVSGSEDNTLKLWNVENGKELKTLSGHTGIVSSVAYSRDGRFIASGSFDGAVKVWSVKTGKEVITLSGDHKGKHSVAYNPNWITIISSAGNYIRVWDMVAGKVVRTIEDKRGISSIACSSDGKYVAAAGEDDNCIIIWDADTGKKLKTLNDHSSGEVTSVAFSRNGKYIASVQMEDKTTIKVWDVDKGEIVKTLENDETGTNSLEFSPDGKKIVFSMDRKVKVWNLETEEVLRLPVDTAEVVSVAFSPDGKNIALGSCDDIVRILNTDCWTP